MGEVYRAVDRRLDRTVALKVLTAEFASTPLRRERFDREARTIATLSHPHICRIYDAGQHHVDGFGRDAPGLRTRDAVAALPRHRQLADAECRADRGGHADRHHAV